MTILIISLPHDVHSLYVAHALSGLGHRVVIWSEPAEAGSMTASLMFEGLSVSLETAKAEFSPGSIHTVWMRRHNRLSMPSWVVEDDEIFVQQENYAFFRWLWAVIAPDARWIHSLTGYLTTEAKVLQMQAAQNAGLQVPTTLFSNDPSTIRCFVRDQAATGGAIYKTFFPIAWDEEKTIKPVMTTLVRESDFQDDEQVRAVPGIYQRKIEKSFEVRSTFFGKRERSVRIASQMAPGGELDWRDIAALDGFLTPYDLPPSINAACLRYMQRLGMAIACFDFIVTPSGEHIFLEANQQGQFLWVEQALPEIPMLREICCLLLDEDPLRAQSWDRLRDTSLAQIDADPRFAAMQASLLNNGFLDTGVSISEI